MPDRLIELLEWSTAPKILVLGDLILDRYLWGQAERKSPEAAVLVFQEGQQENRLGGAANVANMLQHLRAEVTLVGVTGADPDGELLRKMLAASRIPQAAVLKDPARPTTVKQRLLSQVSSRPPQQMLQLDRESRSLLHPLLETQLLDRLICQIPRHDVLLITDYGRGVCTPALLQRAIAVAASQNIPVLVDPYGDANYQNYRGATAFKPNRTESAKVIGRKIESPADAVLAGQRLVTQLQLTKAVVTLDRDGLVVVQQDGSSAIFPTRPRVVEDTTGAGDMVLAMMGLGQALGWSDAATAELSNCAGGLEVEQLGVVCLSREEILQDLTDTVTPGNRKIATVSRLQSLLQARKQRGQKVVFTNGCFDVLHIGHVSYLKQAAGLGDCLVVALNSDLSVQRQGKGADRPIFPVEQRAEMLAALECVDYVVVFEEDTPAQILQKLRPDVLVKGGDYQLEQITGREIVHSYGGAVKILLEVPGVSTTQILSRLRSEPTVYPLPTPQDTPVKKAG